MYDRLDEGDAVIALAGDYFKAMVDADETDLRRVFHPKASIIGHWEGELEFSNLDEFVEFVMTTPATKEGDKALEYRVDDLNLVGDIAVVTVGNYCFGTWFTDYTSSNSRSRISFSCTDLDLRRFLHDVDRDAVGQRIGNEAETVRPLVHLFQIGGINGKPSVESHHGMQIDLRYGRLATCIFSKVGDSPIVKTRNGPFGFRSQSEESHHVATGQRSREGLFRIGVVWVTSPIGSGIYL